MCPAGPSTSSSTRFAQPFQTLRTTVMPSYSTHVVEPVKGCTSRFKWVFQAPISKSHSCCPSCGSGLLDGVFCCAITVVTKEIRMMQHTKKEGVSVRSLFMIWLRVVSGCDFEMRVTLPGCFAGTAL